MEGSKHAMLKGMWPGVSHFEGQGPLPHIWSPKKDLRDCGRILILLKRWSPYGCTLLEGWIQRYNKVVVNSSCPFFAIWSITKHDDRSALNPYNLVRFLVTCPVTFHYVTVACIYLSLFTACSSCSQSFDDMLGFCIHGTGPRYHKIWFPFTKQTCFHKNYAACVRLQARRRSKGESSGHTIASLKCSFEGSEIDFLFNTRYY